MGRPKARGEGAEMTWTGKVHLHVTFPSPSFFPVFCLIFLLKSYQALNLLEGTRDLF